MHGPTNPEQDPTSTWGAYSPLGLALGHMKAALAILDQNASGTTNYAGHLSLAIDLAEEQPLPRDEAECEAMLAKCPDPSAALPPSIED